MRKRNLFITAILCILTLSIQAQENYYGKLVGGINLMHI